MTEFEFLALAIAEWKSLALLSVASALILLLAIRRIVVGGLFDPLMLALVAGYSVNYAIVLLLYIEDQIRLFFVILLLVYGVAMVLAFRAVSTLRGCPAFYRYISAFSPKSVGPAVFKTSLFLYFSLSCFIIASIGFGVFAETNRFEAARGFGSYIRIMDFLSPFIVSYATLSIVQSRRARLIKTVGLVAFVFYAAMVSGAKIAVVFSLITASLALSIASTKLSIRPMTAVFGLAAGLVFSAVALSINLEKNSIGQDESTPLSGTSLVLERFIYRIIASGDTSYLTLPNDVIDKLATDSVIVRFAAPLVGTGNISNLLGYPVGDYSVGRQALLFHDPGYDVFGGPTSHFDLFGYVYFGTVGGLVFVVLLGGLLGSINRSVHTAKHASMRSLNKFRVAWIATLWSRAVLLVIEPTVALAYVVDVMVAFTLLSLILQSLFVPRGRSGRLNPRPVR